MQVGQILDAKNAAAKKEIDLQEAAWKAPQSTFLADFKTAYMTLYKKKLALAAGVEQAGIDFNTCARFLVDELELTAGLQPGGSRRALVLPAVALLLMLVSCCREVCEWSSLSYHGHHHS